MIRDFDFAAILRPYLKSFDSVLDVGCEYGQCLFPFLELGFNTLHGIDRDKKLEEFIPYYFLQYKLNYVNEAPTEVNREFCQEMNLASRRNTFEINSYFPSITVDLKLFEFKFGKEGEIKNFKPELKYDLIIVSNILHFFPPKEREETMKKLYDALNPNGMILLRANTLKKCLKDEGFMSNKEEIARKIYKSENVTYYLFEEVDFQALFTNFSEIEKIKNKVLDQLADIFICMK